MRISMEIRITVVIKAMVSAIGPANITPSIPTDPSGIFPDPTDPDPAAVYGN